MAESRKVRAIREAWRLLNPDAGGNPSLTLTEELKLLIVAAGDQGVSLANLRQSMGRTAREKQEVALAEVRGDPAITETREKRPDAAGRLREQVVLRLCRL